MSFLRMSTFPFALNETISVALNPVFVNR